MSKVILFWTAKGCRKPKMQGTATASCSAATIRDFMIRADEGKGKFYIVECSNAAHGRDMISDHRAMAFGVDRTATAVGIKSVLGNTVALGMRAVAAISGAADSIRQWDSRIATQGRVTTNQSRALQPNSDGLETLTLDGVFGGGLGK